METQIGIMPLPEKVQTIKDIAVPTNNKQLTSFLKVINYYRDMWKHRSDILTPLTKMTSKQATRNWTKEHQKAFEHMEKFISRDILLLVNRLYLTQINFALNKEDILHPTSFKTIMRFQQPNKSLI